MSICPVVLLGGKGVRVSTPLINAFQKKKAWNLPKSSTRRFQNLFFSSSKCDDFKTFFFFLSWKCGDFFSFWKFSKTLASPCMFSWGTFRQIFATKNNNNNNKNKISCFVCVSLGRMLLRNKYNLKKPGDFTVSEGHGYPLVEL